MFYYYAIQDSINRYFNEIIMIYLYNLDESSKKIGTNYGGHSIPLYNTFYYSFFRLDSDYVDKYGIINPFLGAHEMAHVITHKLLGMPGTKLMSEGYANWLDGGYSKYSIIDILKYYRDNESYKVIDPITLLLDESLEDSVYYPNVGVFIGFLINTYGVESVNSLFTVERDIFINSFYSVTGDQWSKMSEKYSQYIKLL